MGPDEFSDPIIIPITLTIPNPNFRRSGRRRGVSHHPSFTDPDWFRRQGLTDVPVVRAQYLSMAPGPVPLLPFVAIPAPLTNKEFEAAWDRATRRAGHTVGEFRRGEFGSAIGHLLGGQPFPAEVEDGFTVNNDEADRRQTLDELTDEIEKDLEKRLSDPLNEDHRETARTTSSASRSSIAEAGCGGTTKRLQRTQTA